MKRCTLLVVALALCACQATTPTYQAASASSGVGYSSVPADNGRQAVTYTGGKGMKPEQVAEFALLRAAELTVAAGHEWFAVLQSASRPVQLGAVNRIDGRSGSVLTGESTTAGSGGDRSSAAPGIRDPAVPGGPTTGGFGGGDVPYQVIERWTPTAVHQTTLLIHMGSGQQASFGDLVSAPEIFSAKAVIDEIRGKMTH